MQTMKKGDPIMITGYESVIADMLSKEDVCSEDMSCQTACPIDTDSGWYISPADCFLVKVPKGTVILDDISMKVEKAIAKKGYYWEIRLETKIPKRSQKRR
jgi:hypothetical protein